MSAVLAKDSNDFGRRIPVLAAFSRYAANATGSGAFVDVVGAHPAHPRQPRRPVLGARRLPEHATPRWGAGHDPARLPGCGVARRRSFLRRLPLRKIVTVVAAALAAALVVAGIVVVVVSGTLHMTITARFATAPGLFTDNFVDVLGMPVGKCHQDHARADLRDA